MAPDDGKTSDPAHGIVNPRLSDVFGLVIRQDEMDFAVPHLREDLPLYLGPGWWLPIPKAKRGL